MANAKTKGVEKGAAAEEDQSMEEILQSIRKIIAEENDDPASAGAESADIADSDVLELTDVIQDDGSVVNVNDDVLEDIDNALSEGEDDFGEEEPAPVPAPKPQPQPQAAAAPAPAPKPKAQPRPKAPDNSEGLVSAVSIAASAEAMRALKTGGNLGSLPFVSGETVEGLVMQLLRPLLKEWLDANLPAIVQQEVQREVRRITATLEEE